MAEYIEREEALALIQPDDPNDERCAVTVATAKRLIRHLLTVTPAADVAPVVRCKNCRYRGLICCPAVHETIGNGLVDYAVDNGYCWCEKPKYD